MAADPGMGEGVVIGQHPLPLNEEKGKYNVKKQGKKKKTEEKARERKKQIYNVYIIYLFYY